MLLSKYSFVGLSSINLSYYEKKGYNIPRYKNDKGKLVFKNGTKIKVKTIDLQKNSMIRVFVKCDCCGKEYYITYRDYLKQNNGGKIYCNKCIKYSHIKNGNNKPINDFNKEKNREIFGYNDFIKKVLYRDSFTCKCCGNKNKKTIKVHHLDGYNWCKEKRTDETNGITLCETCHKNFHMKYGYGNNTKEQFEEWIGHAIGELEKYEGELPTSRKIYCIEEDKIYNSAIHIQKEWNIKGNTNIYNVCNHKIIKRKTKLKNNKTVIKKYIPKTVNKKHIMWLEEAIEKGICKI